MLCTAVFIMVKKWIQHKRLIIESRKSCYIHAVEYTVAIKIKIMTIT